MIFQTIFYTNERGKPPVVAPLTRGTALLHRSVRFFSLFNAGLTFIADTATNAFFTRVLRFSAGQNTSYDLILCL